jgi:hypothetical protein
MFGRALDIGFIDTIFTQQLNSGFWLSNDAFPPIIIKENDQIRNRIKLPIEVVWEIWCKIIENKSLLQLDLKFINFNLKLSCPSVGGN